ncbi:NAD(P)H-hydrate epimerase [Penicillium manginii]|uniref:NAD(P)H-hydrate epimerase n=1 Tax=Penicillium manginii TaxID=203109 RepID=UPI002549AE8E|nr:NAD(P)H-hydrate epimerase [Penicillium manginii]KAJ5755149.1 NAD(P)H-hydrate epimerase [Penicillium manginii]
MAAEFIGYNVLVADVIGQNLMLRDVTLLWNGQRLAQYAIDASSITDLSLESTGMGSSQPQYAQHPPMEAPKPKPKPSVKPSFVDPAILSYAKPALLPTQAHHPAPVANEVPPTVAASLTEPFSDLELNVGTGNIQRGSQAKGFPVAQSVTPAKQTSRRKDRGNNDVPARKHGAAASTNPKSKGWRQTAFVEPATEVTQVSPENLPQPGAKLRKKKTRRTYAEDASGWATEDATDIQELPEFDFASNLSKFDKRTVFEQIRNDDTTADEARLVSFNRKPKPGTNGGKNLHWSENVLDSPQNSDTGDDVDVISDARHSSENISGRDRSRAAGRMQSRKSSGIMAQPMVQQISALGRSQLNISRTTSPRPGRSSVSPMVGPSVSGASLRLTTTSRSCPTVSPLQTLEVEQIAVAEFGLTEDIMTENAGRGIAEAAVANLASDAAAPTMLIITGNHRTGARAFAAARHLRNRGHRVSVCVLGLEHEAELLENCRKQLDIFRKIGGRVLKWEDLSARLSSAELVPDLVVDALFGMHLAFDDLRTEDQAVAFEMITWVNRSKIDVLSVDIPSGMSASNGEVTMVEGNPLCISASSVVCLGAPKTGVLNALVSGLAFGWNLTVADIGIPQIVWRKYGTRRRHGIDFGNRWVVPLQYQSSAQ